MRYIAINDNFDSLYSEGNELAPFKNLFNEWYTRITDLTPEILHTFISKIVIHERSERYKQHSEQQIDIYFTHIGILGEA